MKVIKRKRGIPKQTYRGCPLTHNNSPWCFRMCKPDETGNGDCGRIAPHGLLSEIQKAILKHKLSK